MHRGGAALHAGRKPPALAGGPEPSPWPCTRPSQVPKAPPPQPQLLETCARRACEVCGWMSLGRSACAWSPLARQDGRRLSPPQMALYVLRTPPPRRLLASPVSAASARAPRVRPRSAWLWRVSRVVACVGSLFSREDWRGTCFRVCGVTVPCPCVGRRSPQRGLSAAAASQFLVLRQRKQTVRSRRPAQPPGRASPRALARLDVCALDPAARHPPHLRFVLREPGFLTLHFFIAG